MSAQRVRATADSHRNPALNWANHSP